MKNAIEALTRLRKELEKANALWFEYYNQANWWHYPHGMYTPKRSAVIKNKRRRKRRGRK